MQHTFDMRIPSESVQNSWTDIALNNDISESLQKKREEMDAFIDAENSEMSEVMRKFAGKKVRFTITEIK